MHKIIFYPVGNGDTTQIILSNGKRILFDFRHVEEGEEKDSPYFNLKEHLKKELLDNDKNFFDVVAFTHGDQDHIANSTSFFELNHAEKYKGKDRIKIKELWVPAAMILEEAASDEQSNEFVIWRQEARYRLKEGKGIQVFSKPDKLKDWLKVEGIALKDRLHLITDAGQLAKNITIMEDEVEFFCHSPFIKHCDDGNDLRNSAALIFQIRFIVGGVTTNYLATGDTKAEILEDIIEITKSHHNLDRLDWDIYNIPHHCSYLALNYDGNKGRKKTIPAKLIEELLLRGKPHSYLISSSKPIKDDDEAYKQIQPPHIQAKNCYEEYLKKVDGRAMLVTMEEPNEKEPMPIVFEINEYGHSKQSKSISATVSIISKPTPRAGK